MYVIWHDNDFDFAKWVYENSNLVKEDVVLKCIPKNNSFEHISRSFTSNTDYHILPLIKLATPDLIIQKIDGSVSKLIFASEFMTHTPQHDHVFQRFERIYCISKEKIPIALVLPKQKTKMERGLRDGYREVKYRPSPLTVHTFLKTQNINKNPTLMFFWPEIDGYLKYDNLHQTAPKIESDIELWLRFLNSTLMTNDTNLLNDEIVISQKKYLSKKFLFNKVDFTTVTHELFLENYELAYKLARVYIIKTEKVIKDFKLNTNNLTKEFLKLKYSLIFEYASKKFRTDPYSGFVCGYDNLFCRNDNNVKVLNLILKPTGTKYSVFDDYSEDLKSCPIHSLSNFEKYKLEEIINHYKNCIYTRSKQKRIFGTIPDIIIFDDKVYYNNN